MLCQIAPQHATAIFGTSSTSWTYHATGVESIRQFLAVTKKAASFQDSPPSFDAVPVTVLGETPTLLRCSIPPTQTEPVQDAVQAPICVTFADYVATLPLWDRDLIKLNIESYCPDSSLCELLQQENVKILAASDGGHKDDYGSFGWVIGTEQGNHMRMRRHRTRLPNAVLPCGRIRPHVCSLTVSRHSWSNLVMAGYPLACVNDDAAVRLKDVRNVVKSRLFLIHIAARPEHSGVNGS
jgi:hypothetical protein